RPGSCTRSSGSGARQFVTTDLRRLNMAYTLPPLPYATDALEPYIDAKTMEIHHDKHHQAYVTNLNKALEGTDLGNQPIEVLITQLDKVPEASRTAVRNN